jgi:multidrug resistance efflux pump
MTPTLGNNPVESSSSFQYVPVASDTKPSLGASPTLQMPTSESVVASKSILIDWNTQHPDGSEASLTKLLKSLAERLSIELFIGRVSSAGGVRNIIASHQNRYSKASPASQLKSAILEASLAKQSILVASETICTSGVLENFKSSEEMRFAIGFSIPSSNLSGDNALGLVIGQSNNAPNTIATLTTILPGLRVEIACWLQTWQVCRDGLERGKWSIQKRLSQLPRARWLALGAVAISGLLFMPLPYWPKRTCVVEPAARRFVSSPINGRVLQAPVRPGEEVKAGQSIGQMDDEQLRWELGTAEAELQAASKHQESALAHQEGGKVRLAQIEHQKVALRIKEIQSQLAQLELQSPIDGIVLQGDWYRSEGAAVVRGDVLFEIAPLDRMTVQTHLTTEDLSEIQVGDKVTIRFDNAFGQCWQGNLSRIDPRAEVIDDQVRFVAEFDVENHDGRLRPGMKGSARIETGTKSLGWLLFHRSYVWLMKTIAW